MGSCAAEAASADASLLADVRLACVPGVGARMRQLLIERFGSAEAVFAAEAAEISSIPGIGRKLPALIHTLATDPTAERMLELCRSRGVDIVRADSDAYPGLLARIDDPPQLLFVRGSLEPCDALAVAVVGSRHATAYGRQVAWQLAGGLHGRERPRPRDRRGGPSRRP